MERKTITPKRPGFVLITVLLIVALLTAVLLEFNYSSRNNLRAADNFHTQQQGRYCARAGLNIALAVINQNPDINTNNTLRQMLLGPTAFDIDRGRCTVTIVDENGKININTLKNNHGQLDRNKIDQFLRLIDLLNQQHRFHTPISYGIVPAIIDWTDPDELVTALPFLSHGNLGAESNYYKTALPPRPSKNQPLENIEELLLIRGITAEMLYGNSEVAQDKNPLPAMSDYLTVYGDGKIDINSAPLLVIRSLSEHLDPTIARMIIEQRKHKPIASIAQLRNFPTVTSAIYSALSTLITTQPKARYFRITAEATVGPITQTITAVISKNSTAKNADIIMYSEL